MDNLTWMINALQTDLAVYGGFVVWLSTFLLGENAALAIFALSAQGYISPIKAIFFVFLGSLSADVFWFFMTEYVFRRHYENRLKRRLELDSKKKENKFLITIIDKHFFWVLIFIKFLVGMRLFLTIYIVLKNRIPFHRKVVLDAIGTVLFLFLIFPVGWFFGKGVSSALSFEKGFIKLLSVVVFVFFFSIIMPRIAMFILRIFFGDKRKPQ